jgi:3'-5' exoribonuclease
MTRSISEIRTATLAGSESAEIHVQIEELRKKEGSNGKPFWELKMRDGSDALTLRVWLDTPNFRICDTLANGECIAVTGEFYQNGSYGMDSKRWEIRRLQPGEREILFAGSSAERAAIGADYKFLEETAAQISDPRLLALAVRFLEVHGARFQRAAAARVNHHARRGGLVNHTAQMMRSGLALAHVYSQLNRDLLAAGILFHDIGKLWETCPPEEGFSIAHDVHGELMGHISIGVEVINAIWRELPKDNWQELTPSSESVRLHLIHLILSHHGELEYGSPIMPKTPEAIALHFIDNLDARLEMLFSGYATVPEVAPGIHDRIRPLNINPVAPLAAFNAAGNPTP